VTYHNFTFKCLYTDTSGKTHELLQCEHCGQVKLGQERPGERGVMGPYNPDNGRDTCPTPEEREASLAASGALAAEWRTAREEELERRRGAIRFRAEAAGVTPNELSFSREEAEALYKAGYSSGYESGADGGSFEGALRELGR
jgi:hypothetical protein